MNAPQLQRSASPTDIGLFVIRLMLAVVFLYHGSQKLFGAFGGPGIDGFAGYLGSMSVPMPKVSAIMAACTEFLGGVVLLVGTGTRIAALPMIITMLTAFFTAHKGAFDVQKGGGEYPLTLAAVILGLALAGPGRLSIGSLLKR